MTRASTPRADAVARARAAIGTPFRLHGRDLTGLDCVGLVGWAWGVTVPTGYALRSAPAMRLTRAMDRNGFVASPPLPGTIVLMAPGPGQLHLGIAAGDDGVIHADAMIRRVVERAPVPWPFLAAWTREG